MATQQRKPTKAGSLTSAFTQAAARDPEGALSQMMLAAFGVTLSTLMAVATKALAAGDLQLIIMAMTAGVQIRNHVVFVGREYGNVRTAYPELIIEGDREQRDIFNFGALHALGHVFAHVTGNDLGSKIISKAGSCVTGERLTDSEAGKINREIYVGWTTEDKGSWSAWLANAQTTHRTGLDPIVASVPTRARAFAASMAAPVPPRPVPAPARAAGT
jgi:hypothetical protein